MSRRDLPIGVFDSGIGGLTVLAALRARLPRESFTYLGDTARVPYGTKSPETVRRYAEQVTRRLVSEGVKMLVIGCNTASAHALPALRIAYGGAGEEIPVEGVVEPGVRAALALTRGGGIAVAATEGTVRAGAYQEALRRLAPGVRVEARACPLFVALAEEGWTDGDVASLTARLYLADLPATGVDTLVLGCTHYPLLRGVIEGAVGPGVAVVDSAVATADAVAASLEAAGLLRHPSAAPPTVRFQVTDGPERFARVGSLFLAEPIPEVSLVDL